MKKKVFSLASVNITLLNENFGEQISIGGGGKLVGTIGYTYKDSLFTVESTADGGTAVSVNKSVAGSISIDFKQTAEKIDELVKYIKRCWAEPEKAEATITCRDTAGNMNFYAKGVFPAKLPDNSISESIGSRSFEFVCCEIYEEVK